MEGRKIDFLFVPSEPLHAMSSSRKKFGTQQIGLRNGERRSGKSMSPALLDVA
jgi:hypothetical protein